MDFKSGNKHAIIGINGAGKSTLLNAISGRIRCDSDDGFIAINGKELVKFSVKERAKRLAILSQSTSVLFNYSVKDIILMGLYPYDIDQTRREALLNEACQLLSLAKQIDLRFQALSGGLQQRVHLARVILQIIADKDKATEKWLLLDEHAAGLDLYQQAKIFNVLDHLLTAYNLGIIMVIHDVNIAAKFCDQMLLMDQGKVIKNGDPKKVILDDKFRDAFQIEAKYLPKENAFLFEPI